MGNWVVWLAVFLGFAAVLAVGVVLIAVEIILRAQAAGRRGIKGLPPPRPRSHVPRVVRRVAVALLMLSPVVLVGAAAVLAVMHLRR
jgi:hypothetical protein